MLTYAFLLAFVVACSAVASRVRRGAPSLPYVLIAATALTLVLGLRDGTGTDTRTYEYWYRELLRYESVAQSKDPGFTLLCRAIAVWSGPEPVWMFLVVGAATVVPVALVLRTCARPYSLAMALYVLSGLYFFAFNGVRQALAGSVMFAATPLLARRRWGWYIAAVLAAATLHSSVLVMLPIAVLALGGSRLAVGASVGAVLAGIFALYGPLVSALAASAGDSRYGDYAEELVSGTHGANVMRLVVRVGIAGAALARRRSLVELHPRMGSFLVNVSLVSAALYALALKHWVFARVAFYPCLFDLILIPALAEGVRGRGRPAAIVGLVGAYCVFAAVMLMSGDSHLLPYRNVLGF